LAKVSAVIDTCVILNDTDVISRMNQIGYPIVTDVVLSELDGLKKNDFTADDAKTFFRNMSIESENLTETPDGIKITKGDRLTKFSYQNQFVFVLNRTKYKSKGNNDSKIREIAKDYGFKFVTADRANKIAAEAEGISSVFRVCSSQRLRSKTKSKSKKSPIKKSIAIDKFKLPKFLTEINDDLITISAMPKGGDTVYFPDRKSSVKLGKKVASGGEGVVYETDRQNTVAKIYHKTHLTQSRKDKLDLMLSKPIKHPSICWPQSLLVNLSGDFCGYIMPKAEGLVLQTSVFIPALLKRKLSSWSRINLVSLALKFAEAIKFLNERNVIIGDINPNNVLVSENGSSIQIVDCDSFQIEGFPCSVGTVHFTAADIQGKDYKSFLRSKEHEEYALATMIFMILMPGKHPYAQEGGTSPADNIKAGEFPYPFGPEYRSHNVASGPWRYIWSHLPWPIKQAFHNVFRLKKTISSSQWVKFLSDYIEQLEEGLHTKELFPSSIKVPAKDAVTRTCDKEGCGNTFKVHKKLEAQQSAAGKNLYCPSCLRQFSVEKLAREASNESSANRYRPSQKTSSRSKPLRSKNWKQRVNRKKSTQYNKKSQDDGSVLLVFLALGGVIWLVYVLGWFILPIAVGIYLLIKYFGKAE
jgi:hypothetical protein